MHHPEPQAVRDEIHSVARPRLLPAPATGEPIPCDLAGIPTTLKAADVKEFKPSASTLMGPHLMDALTMNQFADIIAYLHSLK